MKKVLFLMFLIILLFTLSCKKEYDIKSYYNNDDNLTIEINGMTYHSVSFYHIKDPNQKIGKVKLDGEMYLVYTNSNDVELRYLYLRRNSIFADKERNIFIRDDIYLPKISEMKKYKLSYDGKEYEYDIVKYYLIDSDVDVFKESVILYDFDIEFEETPYIYYRLSIYYCNEHYYMKNYNGKFVELNNFPFKLNE